MDISNDEQKVKEYYDLNGFYLKILFHNQIISLISYNSNLLDGIKYVKTLKLDEIKKNEKLSSLSVMQLFEIIAKKIEEKKFMINSDNNNIILTLFRNNTFNSTTDIQFLLTKNIQYPKNEYENVLSNIIINLREENKNMRNEINQIKNILIKLNKEKELVDFPNKQTQDISNDISRPDSKLRGKKEKNSKFSLSHNPIQNPTQDLIQNPIKNQPQKRVENQPQIIIQNQIQNQNKKPLENQEDINKDNGMNLNDIHLNRNSDFNKKNINNNINFEELNPNNMKAKTQIKNKSVNSVTNSLTISRLANLEYGLYPPVELSSNSFCLISGYGANSYNGIVRNYNEDKIKVILDYKLEKEVHTKNGNIIKPKISYFAIYDGHGGNNCSNFLQEKLHSLLFNSEYFPLYTIQAINDAYNKAEMEFKSLAFDSKNGKLLNKSGSCTISVLILDEWCFITNLGDSRGLMSFDSGNHFYQITRDHKPNDPIEKSRIEKVGGSIYKDTRVKINGKKVFIKEEDLKPGLSFPFRVSPGNLAVSIIKIFIIF